MTVLSTSPHSSRFAQSTRVPISHLDPRPDAHPPRHIKAVVALVWPYSSSTKSLSLLLAEPDVRLRKGNGQVKVTFHGSSAEAVAKGQVGIGDTVQLGLEGAQWVQTSQNVSTPGKKIGWDLVFDGRAEIDVKRGSQTVATISVDFPVRASATDNLLKTQGPQASLNGTGPTQYLNNANSWSSPTFVKGKTLASSSVYNASLDPFADEDDGFVVGKGRKRTKFARHSDSWRLVDRTPSPEKEPVDVHLDNGTGLTETAALPSQPESPNHEVETIGGQSLVAAPVDFTAADGSTVAGDTEPLLRLPGLPHADLVPQAPEAATSPHAHLQGLGQIQSTRISPRQAPYISYMAIDSGERTDGTFPSLSDVQTPPLEVFPSSDLPLVPPLIGQPRLSSGHAPDSSENRLGLNVSGEQSLPAPERKVSISDESAPSPDVEHISLLPPAQPLKIHAQEHEATVQDTFELSSPRQQLSSRSDEPVLSTPWASLHEGVQQTYITPCGQEQDSPHAEALDFEFLNTSPVEAYRDGQHLWHSQVTVASTMGTPEAPKDAGPLELEQTPDQPAHLPGVVTHAVPQYSHQSAAVPHHFSKSDTANPHIGWVTQDESVDKIPEVAPDSSLKVPIDPSLVTSLEAAAEFVTSSSVGEQISEEVPEQVNDSFPWSDKLDISAVDAESQRVYTAPPFPFEQRWHRKPQSQQSTHSSQYASVNRDSDEDLVDDSSEVENISEDSHRHEILEDDRLSPVGPKFGNNNREPDLALSPAFVDEPQYRNSDTPSKDGSLHDIQARGGSQNVVVLDSSDEDASSAIASPERVADLKTNEVDDIRTEIRMNMNTILESQEERNGDHVRLPLSADGGRHGLAIESTAVTERDRTQIENSPTQSQGRSREHTEPPMESVNVTRPLEEAPAQNLNDQLVTPKNTQQERGDTQLQEYSTEAGREVSLPPTPQNTQEYADLPQPTVEMPTPIAAEIEASQTPNMPLPIGVDKIHERRRSPRLSRKIPPSQDVTEVVSPYFTPRRTGQIRPRDHLGTPPKTAILETSPAAANDSIQMAEKESRPSDQALPDKETISSSPVLAQPKLGYRSRFSYYTPLSLLQDHFSRSVDVLALSTTYSTEPQKAKSGPRDWYTTFHLTEASLQGSQTVTVQIFRPYNTALPKIQRGNLMLLRNFNVQSQKRKYMLLSTESSAWTVFSVRKEKEGQVPDIDAVIVGPPVEYGAEEKAYILELSKWWDAEGEGRHPIQKQDNQRSKDDLVTSKDDIGIVAHELRDGKVYHGYKDGDEQAGVSETCHELRDGTLYGNDTQGKLSKSERKSFEKSGQSKDVGLVHELRDGTVYQDDTPTWAPKNHQKTSNGGSTGASTHNGDIKPRGESAPESETHDINPDSNSIDVDLEAEMDSGEESPTDVAVSSQIYHELRNGRRYVDPVPDQRHAKELPQEGEEDEDESLVHELRDGLTYTDD